MATFEYTARTSSGKLSPGSLTAPSRREALDVLKQRMLLPVSLKERAAAKSGRKVKPAAVAAVYEQLADLLESGVSLLNSLDVLVEQAEDPALNTTLSDLRAAVADGQPLASAMREFPDVFAELPVSVIHAGEEGGFLDSALRRVATHSEREEEMKSRVVGALAYPALLLVAGFLVVAGMLTFFVPKFEPLFDRTRERGELPMPTHILLTVSGVLKSQFMWIAIAAAIVSFAIYRWLTSDSGRLWLDRFRMNMIGIGPVTRSLAISRFCRVLGTLLQNGVPILKSLEIAVHASGNRLLSTAISDAAQNVSSGKSLTEPLVASRQFPRDVLEMISVGEQANRLDKVLLEISDRLDRRSQRKLDLLVKMLEPAMMMILAMIIGFLVVALLMPVFSSKGLS